VYSAPTENEETLNRTIFIDVNPLAIASGTLEMVQQSMIRRVPEWTDSGGGHFEHFL
jgi:hypothetical protein